MFDFGACLQEQELYHKEGLGVNEVHYVDNQDCIGRFLFVIFPTLLKPHPVCKDFPFHYFSVWTVNFIKFMIYLKKVRYILQRKRQM